MTVAGVASALPVASAARLAGGLWHKLPAFAVATALLSLGVWFWMLDRDSEWCGLLPV